MAAIPAMKCNATAEERAIRAIAPKGILLLYGKSHEDLCETLWGQYGSRWHAGSGPTKPKARARRV
jgi:hypothetical protein